MGSRFRTPPLDGSLTIPEIWDWHYEHNPHKPVFRYDSLGKTIALPYNKIVPAAHEAGAFLLATIGCDPRVGIKHRIGIVASTDTVTFFCTILGAMRAGICAAIISPRNSPAAVAHLLKAVGASFAFVSSESSIRCLVEDACQLLADESSDTKIPHIFSMPTFEDIMTSSKTLKLAAYPSPWLLDRNSPAVYSHSSGSTSLPKPLPWNHTFLIQVSLAPLSGHHDFENQCFAWHCVAMSHGSGLHLIPWIASSGLVVTTFPPQTPAQFPSSQATWEGFTQSSADYLVLFPYFLEEWSSDPGKIELLKGLKGVIFVGGFLNREIGNLLALAGVKLFPLYGITEAGVLGSFLPPAQGLEWEYFSMTPLSGAVFHPAEDGLYELILVQSTSRPLAVTNTTYLGSDAYSTKDLFLKHPTQEGFWKPIGRRDELLILSNGKKVNPLPMEDILSSDPRLSGALIFGQGRLRCGALLEVQSDYVLDAGDRVQAQQMSTALRDVIEQANKIASGHAKIYPEMIIFADSARPFQHTEKGTIRRSRVLDSYKQDIDSLYDQPQDLFPEELTVPQSLDATTALGLAYGAIKHVLPGIAELDDIFHFGCDSLQATRIESIVREGLKRAGIAFQHKNFVYNHPTSHALATFILSRSLESYEANQTPLHQMSNTALHAILSSFAAHIQTSKSSEADSPVDDTTDEAKVVLITGTTGRLGANTLYRLFNDNRVKRIYALNRCRPGESLQRKQERVLLEHGLDGNIGHSAKVFLLDGDLRLPGLGLGDGIYDELCSQVTHIIHLAWPVDWKIKLNSFDGMLQGVVNLINLALSSARRQSPRFLFASTIGVFNNPEEGFTIPETHLETLDVALGQGYSESKAIAEALLQQIARTSALRPVIVRIGQIAGSNNGAWKSTEWVPALIKSSVSIGALPVTTADVSWIPASLAGQALIDFLDTSSPVVNLVHPNRKPVSYIMRVFGEQLRLPTIPYEEWMARLERKGHDTAEQDEDVDAVPALKMLGFFQRHGINDFRVDDTLCQVISPSLGSAPPLDEETIVKWLSYWRHSGFL